jgi:hypothetical protein
MVDTDPVPSIIRPSSLPVNRLPLSDYKATHSSQQSQVLRSQQDPELISQELNTFAAKIMVFMNFL